MFRRSVLTNRGRPCTLHRAELHVVALLSLRFGVALAVGLTRNRHPR